MIDTVADALAAKLKTLQYLSICAGVARAQKLKTVNKEAFVEKTLPAYPDKSKKDGYVWLTPQSAESGISYFEVLSNEKTDDFSGGRASRHTAKLRLIVWLNMRRLSANSVDEVVLSCVSTLQGKCGDAGAVSYINVTPDRQVPRGPELFSRWSYDEAETQFLMLPYEYFAYDFSVSYVFTPGCLVPNITTTKKQC